MIKKKMATSMTPKLTITVEGDVITTKIEAGLKTNSNSFKIGEEYEIEMELGTSKVYLTLRTARPFYSLYFLTYDKLILNQYRPSVLSVGHGKQCRLLRSLNSQEGRGRISFDVPCYT